MEEIDLDENGMPSAPTDQKPTVPQLAIPTPGVPIVIEPIVITDKALAAQNMTASQPVIVPSTENMSDQAATTLSPSQIAGVSDLGPPDQAQSSEYGGAAADGHTHP